MDRQIRMAPIETWERVAHSGPYTKLGDTPPPATGTEDAPATSEARVPAAPDSSPASPSQSGETSAPHSEAPRDTPPAPAAASGAPALGEDDDEPEPAVATMDYVQRRIRRLTAQRRATERAMQTERQQSAQQLGELRPQIDLMTRMMAGQAPTVPEAQPAGPPQAEQYTSHDEYVKAIARYEVQQSREQQTQETQQTQHRQYVEQMGRELMDREAAFRQQHPDFDDVLRAHLAGKVAPHVQQGLMLHPDGPAIAYALATQPDTLQRLNQLPPPQMLMELGRLTPAGPPAAQGLPPIAPNGSAPSGPAQQAQLPPPLTPVNGQGQAPTPGYRPDMTQEEYRRYRQQTSTLPVWKQR